MRNTTFTSPGNTNQATFPRAPEAHPKAKGGGRTHNPYPYVVVTHPGQDDEDVVCDFSTETQARAFMRDLPGTDLMRRLSNGVLTTEF